MCTLPHTACHPIRYSQTVPHITLTSHPPPHLSNVPFIPPSKVPAIQEDCYPQSICNLYSVLATKCWWASKYDPECARNKITLTTPIQAECEASPILYRPGKGSSLQMRCFKFHCHRGKPWYVCGHAVSTARQRKYDLDRLVFIRSTLKPPKSQKVFLH